uniref:mitogen-activated protein kinase kinase n=1 Tax=Kwoniella pini CBS 10737 TaxID=1296096 RepID=A0A1B9HXG9_9TREE|nr:STE/STE7/MKK protein kinase [Kwoniella pini CBS 10737]OCF47973.1 STE/STE7/MKK protein kinase [Kwoniella pini CBS 10737]
MDNHTVPLAGSSSGSGNAPARRPGGARPNPTRIGSAAPPPPKLSIPPGNVPGINVDQAGENGWQIPSSLPALALRPMRASPSPSNRPKLSLSGVSTPSTTPLPPPSSTPLPPPLPLPLPLPRAQSHSSRPPLLDAPSQQYLSGSSNGAGPSSRTSTPILKLSIPGSSATSSGGTGPGFSSGHEYTLNASSDHDDILNSALKTPTPFLSGEDTNPTLQARGNNYEDDESSYGFGRLNNGLENGEGKRISEMTEDIRQALTKSRFDTNNSTPNRSRANSSSSKRSLSTSKSRSRANSSTNQSRRDSSGSMIGGGKNEHGYVGQNVIVSEEDHQKESPTFDPDDLVSIRRLGEGTGGAVELVQDKRTGKIMAKKVIARTTNPSMHKQLLRELEILNVCSSPYIVEHYGSFLTERDSVIGILMEYCEAGSLDYLLGKMKMRGMMCSEHVLGRIASSVLKGLDYLHDHRIIHRDIKPSNIVLNKQGVVKLCDFGVSGELVDSIAGTFTGTSFYMAPERIQNQPYTIKADVWSLGMTLHEVAHLRFPFPPEGENQSVAPIELLSYIVTAPTPIMVDDPSVGRVWSDGFKSFMADCLIRSGTDRPYPWQLLEHPFIVANEAKKVNMAKWVAALCQWPYP